MPPTLPSDLHHHIIDLVLSSAIGWSYCDSLQLRGLHAPKATKEFEARAFLARCCLVSKYWLQHARKRLYTFMRLRPAVQQSLEANPCLARYTQYLNVDARITGADGVKRSALELFQTAHTKFPSLKSLLIWDNSYIGVTLPKVPAWHASASSLTHLLSMGSSAFNVACLVAALPNLSSLHVGRLSYARFPNRESLVLPVATCRLREIVFQTVFRLDSRFLNCILDPSKESLKAVTLASCGPAVYDDTLEYITGITDLTLLVKEGDFNGRGEETDNLDYVLTKFSNLQTVSVLYQSVGLEAQVTATLPTASYIRGEILA